MHDFVIRNIEYFQLKFLFFLIFSHYCPSPLTHRPPRENPTTCLHSSIADEASGLPAVSIAPSAL
uniref:Uncharacterized protein n=1 Tax=Helianthus annuus TaxID=4232 RepID=A0A251SBM7_HELAN